MITIKGNATRYTQNIPTPNSIRIENIEGNIETAKSYHGGGGVEEIFDKFAENLEIEEARGNASYIAQSAFTGFKIKKATFNNASYVSDTAFSTCNSLTEINFENAKQIQGAFNYCDSLETVNVPSCESISSCFHDCISLTSVCFPKCKTLVNSLNNCDSLETVILPECSLISNCFSRCYNLSEIYAPKVERIYSVERLIGDNYYQSCSQFSSVYYGSFFKGATILTTVPPTVNEGDFNADIKYLSEMQSRSDYTLSITDHNMFFYANKNASEADLSYFNHFGEYQNVFRTTSDKYDFEQHYTDYVYCYVGTIVLPDCLSPYASNITSSINYQFWSQVSEIFPRFASYYE